MIYILNGGAPEKIKLFLNRKDVILLDNHNDNSNEINFNHLDESGAIKDGDYILITSEDQRYWLNAHPSFKNKYKDNLILIDSTKYDLSSKAVITKIEGQEYPQLAGKVKDFNEDKISREFNGKYIVKPIHGSGSRGIHSSVSMGIFKGEDLPLESFDPEDEVVIERIYSQDDYVYYTLPTVIKDGKVIIIVPIRSADYFQGQAKWKAIALDTRYYDKLYKIMQSITNQLQLTSGILEPEILIKIENGKMNFDKWNIIDLNPRWSYDCGTCSKLVVNSGLSNRFNLLDIYLKYDKPLDFLNRTYRNDIYLLADTYIKITHNNFEYDKFKDDIE